MDYSLPGSSVHGILQARLFTGVGSHSLLQGIFPTQGLNLGLLHCRQVLYVWATRVCMNICISHTYTHTHIIYLYIYTYSYTHSYLNSLCTCIQLTSHTCTMTQTHMRHTPPLSHTILSLSDAYTFHFSLHAPWMTPMPLLCLHYLFCLKSLSLSSPLTDTLSILSTSSLNTTAPLQPNSPARVHFWTFLFPWILLRVHS